MSEEAKMVEDVAEDARYWRKEADRWMRVAAYLAQCHAATLEHEGGLKSCPVSRRERYVHICEIAADMLEGKPISKSLHGETVEKAAERCRKAARGE